jgi:heme-degrading monooxygenase HmoA
MIARVWRGWATPHDADTYERHFRSSVVPHLSEIEGYRGARLLRRSDGGEESFVSITFFDSVDAIRAFAGEDVEAAVVEPEARRALSRVEERCTHYTVVVADTRDA